MAQEESGGGGGDAAPRGRALVCDANVFFRRPQELHRLAFERLHAPPSVLAEIRDAAARRNLAFQVQLPTVTDPSDADVKFVRWFAAKTGDLGSLSAPDIDAIALTYMLQRQTGDVSKLRSAPLETDSLEIVRSNAEDTGGPASWGLVSRRKGVNESVLRTESKVAEYPAAAGADGESTDCENGGECGGRAGESNGSDSNSGSDGASSDEENELEWIGEDNLPEFLSTMSAVPSTAASGGVEAAPAAVASEGPPLVACATSDFAVQNVLLQMGLAVVSLTGQRIQAVRQWALRCVGCFEVMRDTSRQFCSRCGNYVLSRVTLTRDAAGRAVVAEPAAAACRRNVHSRIYPVPMNRGGRGFSPLILCEDHLYMHGREVLARRAQKMRAKAAAALRAGDDDDFVGFAVAPAKQIPALRVGQRPTAHRVHRHKKKKT